MRWIMTFLIMMMAMTASQASAGDLTEQITQFFKARDPQHAAQMSVIIRTPAEQWPDCDNPRFSLPGNGRLWGNISVAANCTQQRRYLQVQVQVTGDYIVAAHHLPRGTAITSADLQIKQGRLDTLPAQILLKKEEALDAISLRDILPDQPVTRQMLRRTWRIKAGQRVTVTVRGNGFDIMGEGQALNNAAVMETVKIRMGNGQIVNGKVNADGNILITL